MSRTQAIRDRLVLLRDGRPGPDGGRQSTFMLDVARQAWASCTHAMFTAKLPFAAGFLVMFEAGVMAGGAGSRFHDLQARTRGGEVPFYSAEPGTVLLIALMLAASLLATAWVQTMLMRLVLNPPEDTGAGDDENWLATLLPGHEFAALLGTIAVPEFCTVIVFVGLVLALVSLNHVMGTVSAALSLPLLLAPMALACVACLRASLAPCPAALGLAEPLAESWNITRGRVPLLLGTFIIGLGPFLLLALAWPALAQPAGFGTWQALWTAAIAVPAFGVQGGITAHLYERWRTALRPDMRPSRHRNRRREPLLT